MRQVHGNAGLSIPKLFAGDPYAIHASYALFKRKEARPDDLQAAHRKHDLIRSQASVADPNRAQGSRRKRFRSDQLESQRWIDRIERSLGNYLMVWWG